MSDGLGNRLLLGAISRKSFDVFKKYKISRSDLLDDAKQGYDFIIEHITKYGDFPTLRVFIEQFKLDPSFEELDSPEFLADSVRKRSMQNRLIGLLERSSEKLQDLDPDGAFEELRQNLFTLRDYSELQDPAKFKEEREARYRFYETSKEETVFEGVTVPWKSLETAILGFSNGTLNVALAMTSTGKTWLSCILARHAMLEGKKVLFVSLETPADKIHRRIDAIHFKLPARDHMQGSLSDEVENSWKSRLTEDIPGDIITVDKKSVSTVADTLSLVNESRPDFVIVDGAYRFKASARSAWESAAAIVRDLQLAAEFTDIPWFVTSQLGSATDTGAQPKPGTPMRAWSARYAKEFAIDPDTVIGLRQSTDQRVLNVMEVHIMKIRDGFGSNAVEMFNIHWNPRDMDFSEIVEDSDSFDSDTVSY